MKVPKAISKYVLLEDEKVLYHARQRRLSNLIHPRSLVVTDKQLLFFLPGFFGYKLLSYDYSFIQDVFVTNRPVASKVRIRTMWADVELGGLPRKSANQVVSAVRTWLESKNKPEQTTTHT